MKNMQNTSILRPSITWRSRVKFKSASSTPCKQSFKDIIFFLKGCVIYEFIIIFHSEFHMVKPTEEAKVKQEIIDNAGGTDDEGMTVNDIMIVGNEVNHN